MNLELKNKLMNLKSQTLVLDLKNLVGEERKLKAWILHYLWVIQCKRIFAEFGYPSLFEFCIKHLGYTEAETQRRISAMRLLGELPQIEEKITEGKLSLSALSMAQSLFRQEAKGKNAFSKEQKIEVLEILENKSVRECEKELLKFSSQLILPRERVRPITENTVEVKFNAPNEFIEKLEKLKALRSHKTGGASTFETISNLVDEALKVAEKEKLGCKKVVTKKVAGEIGLCAGQMGSIKLNLDADRIDLGTGEMGLNAEKKGSDAGEIGSEVGRVDLDTEELGANVCNIDSDKVLFYSDEGKRNLDTVEVGLNAIEMGSDGSKIASDANQMRSPITQEVKAGQTATDARRSVSVAQQVALNLTGDNRTVTKHEIKREVRRNVLGNISRKICQNIWRKHNAKCAYVDPHTNKKCESEYFLEIEHIKPRALGGDNLPENLKLYCRAHNQLAAIQQLGFKKMSRFINKSKNHGE